MKRILPNIILPTVLSIAAFVFAAINDDVLWRIVACVLGIMSTLLTAANAYKNEKDFQTVKTHTNQNTQSLTYTTEEDNANPLSE